MTTKLPMKASYRDEWLKRLRSGQYVQGVNKLRKRVEGQESYCCLGVLCDIVTEQIESITWKFPEYDGDVVLYSPMKDGSMCGCVSIPSFSVQQELFNTNYTKDIELRVFLRTLMDMNDRDTKSFLEIAEYIEANTEGV